MRFTIEVFALAYVLVAALFATPTVVDMYSAKGLGECREVTVKMLTDLLPLRQVERFTPGVYVGDARAWVAVDLRVGARLATRRLPPWAPGHLSAACPARRGRCSVIRIDNWRVDVDGTDFDAPEVRRPCLRGVVVGHPLVPDGTTVMTSPIVMMTGERAATERGRVYELGVMEAGYARFLQAQAAWGQRLVLGVPIEDLLQRAPTLAALDDRAAAFGESEGA